MTMWIYLTTISVFKCGTFIYVKYFDIKIVDALLVKFVWDFHDTIESFKNMHEVLTWRKCAYWLSNYFEWFALVYYISTNWFE